MKKPLLVLAVALALAGCTTIQPPAVSLVNVQLGTATAFETSAKFTLRLTNDSPEPLVLNGGSFKIYINGLAVGTGVSDEVISLPRLASGTMTVSVHLSNLRLATRIRPLLESRSFDYSITGKLFSTQPGGTVRFRDEGRLDLKDFQPEHALETGGR